jgi:hypothetical protein
MRSLDGWEGEADRGTPGRRLRAKKGIVFHCNSHYMQNPARVKEKKNLTSLV